MVVVSKMERKDIMLNILVTFAGVILIFFAIQFAQIRRNILSVTFWVVLLGTILFCILVWLRGWIYDYKKLDKNTAKFYYTQLLETLRTMFIGFILSFSIIWAFLREIPGGNLQHQSLLLLFFLFYISLSSLVTFIRELNPKVKSPDEEVTKKYRNKRNH